MIDPLKEYQWALCYKGLNVHQFLGTVHDLHIAIATNRHIIHKLPDAILFREYLDQPFEEMKQPDAIYLPRRQDDSP